MDWQGFFTDHNIDFITRGQNVKKNNINIACPLCGEDPSYHMGVSLVEKDGYFQWGCWRSASHAGKKPTRLIRALLNCSYQAAELLAQQYSQADPSSIDSISNPFERADKATDKPTKGKRLAMPPEFRQISPKGTTLRFYKYLTDRGFNDVTGLCDIYKLRCANTGNFKDRIIIPIFIKNKLVSWTSRALGKTINAPRYLALSEEKGGLVNVFHTLWNYDDLQIGGDLMIIVEGPFDALKLDFYGAEMGATTTCTFGTAMSVEQGLMIREIAKKFKRRILLYDPGEVESIFLAQEKLIGSGVDTVSLNDIIPDVEDPGAMSKKQVRKLVKKLL